METAIDRFIRHLAVEKGLSENYQLSVRRSLEAFAAWVENGEYPADWKALEKMVRGVCYNNAVEFFGFPLEKA